MIDALIIEAIRRGIPTPARQAADRLGILSPAQNLAHECLPEWERALMQEA